MNSILQELRHALRVLLKNPGGTGIAVLALALGIGANISAFTSVSALVLHPLPYPRQERLMTLWETIPKLRAERDAVSPANFFDWKRQSRSFDYMAAYQPVDMNLTGVSDPERVSACLVTPEFFAALAMKPELGRTFLADEAEPGRDGVVVVSRGFWQRRLASVPDAVGREVSMDGRRYTITAVMPADFDFPLGTDVWAPLAFSGVEKNQRAAHSLMVLARLKLGVSVARARAEMDTIAARIERQYPRTNEGRAAAVVPLRELTNEGTDRFAVILLCAALFVLLLACANIGNLQVARVADRQREIAVRTALGASRFQIARQLLTESILIGLAAGALGLVLASWNLDLMSASIPAQVFKWVAGLKNMRIDGGVLAFTLAASVAAGFLCGIAAVFQTLRRGASDELNEALKEGGRSSVAGPQRGRLRSGLVVAEVALALVLLTGAGLMVKTFQRMLTLHPGFNPENLLTMQISLPAAKYEDSARISAFYDRALQGLDTLPGVKAAGASGDAGVAEGLRIEGRPEPRPGESVPAIKAVAGRYFEAMGIPVLRGRAVSERDGAETPRVVILSEMVARHYWPHSDPIGQRLKLGSSESPWLTVIGVSGDTRDWFTGEPSPRAYISGSQTPGAAMTVVIRTAGDPLQMANGAVAQVHGIDRNQPVYDIKSMEQIIAEQTSGVRASAVTMSVYAVIALLLATTGIYAVMSYSVVQRTHEMGIRIALGAGQADVLRLALRQALRLAAVGLAIGVPAAFALTRLMSSALYNVIAVDWKTFAALTALLGLCALLAGYIPARRVAGIDPVVALRHE